MNMTTSVAIILVALGTIGNSVAIFLAKEGTDNRKTDFYQIHL
ncbi:hypothetical protein WKW47_07265 [Staphylococcus nepalensis]